MRSRRLWTNLEIFHLENLLQSGAYTYPEIAELLGRSKGVIQLKAQYLGYRNPVYRIRRTKHKHLREPVMRYFMKHTAEETRKHFNLTQSEFKSIMTIGYQEPHLKHLRKDTRRQDAWSAYEYKFLLRHAGLKPRTWIAKKLKRGGVHSIKDRLDKLQIASRTLNGMTLSQYRQAFAKEPTWLVETDAGPKGGISGSSHFKIVPWVQVQEDIQKRRVQTTKLLEQIVESMALFQKWVHGKNAKRSIREITK